MTPQPTIASLSEQLRILTFQVQRLQATLDEQSDILHSRNAAAEYAGVASSTITRWVNQGMPKHGRSYRRSEIDQWKRENGK